MKKKNQVILAATYLFAGAAFAQPVPCDSLVINRGFEAPVLVENQYSYFIPGWTVIGDAGSFNPGPVTYPDGMVYEGNNCGYVSCCAGGREPGIMAQILPAILDPNTTYELSIAVGQRLETPWANFQLQLLAGDTPLISILVDNPPMPGTFSMRNFEYVSPATHGSLGLPLEIRMTHMGDIEHQANFDSLSLTAQSHIIGVCTPPTPVQTCPGATAEFNTAHSGTGPFTYQWNKDNLPLIDGTTAWGSMISGANTFHLTIGSLQTDDNGMYSLTIVNEHGSMKTPDARLLVCPADFNCDGSLDFFDYLDFVDAFSGNQPAADWNKDLVIDFFDYLDFVDAFARGC